MKLSITAIESAKWDTPLVLRGKYTSCINEAARLGYDGIELHLLDSDSIDRSELHKALTSAGIALTTIGTGPSYSQQHLFFTSPEKEVRQEAIHRMMGHIQLGADTGAAVIIGLIKGQKKDVGNDSIYDELFFSSIDRCVREAERLGVSLVLEVIDRYESDWLNTVEEGLKLLKKIPSSCLKLHLDTYHMNIEEADLYGAVIQAGDKVGHVHVADSDRWYPGHGHYNFEELFHALSQIQYSRAIALESFPYPAIEICAQNAQKKLRKLMF